MKNREPLFSAAVVVAIVASALQMLVSFGLGLSPDQIQSVMTFVTVVAPLLVAYIARKKVTPLAEPRNAEGERLVPINAEETH